MNLTKFLITLVFFFANNLFAILGGKLDLKGQYPQVVELSILKGNKQTKCSAVIISENVILTAAHCLTHKKNIEKIKIDDIKALKSFNPKTLKSEKLDSSLLKTIDHIVIHPLYKQKFNNTCGKGTECIHHSYDLAAIVFRKERNLLNELNLLKQVISTSLVEFNQEYFSIGYGKSSLDLWEHEDYRRKIGKMVLRHYSKSKDFLTTNYSIFTEGSQRKIRFDMSDQILSRDSGSPLYNSSGIIVGIGVASRKYRRAYPNGNVTIAKSIFARLDKEYSEVFFNTVKKHSGIIYLER